MHTTTASIPNVSVRVLVEWEAEQRYLFLIQLGFTRFIQDLGKRRGHADILSV